MLSPGVIFKFKIHQNAYATGASPRTPLGKKGNYRPPRPNSWFSGSRFAAGERERGGLKEEKEEREGDSVTPLIFYNLTTAQQCIDCCDLYTVARL